VRTIFFFKTISPAVFVPRFPVGRWANVEVGTWGEVSRKS